MLENRPSQLLPLPSDNFGTVTAAVPPPPHPTKTGQPQTSSVAAQQKLKSKPAPRSGVPGTISSLPSLPPLPNPHLEDPRSTAKLPQIGVHHDRELEAQRLRILEKVWSGVERAVEELRERIWEDVGRCVRYREDGYDWKEGNICAGGAQGQAQVLGVGLQSIVGKGMKLEKYIEYAFYFHCV